MKKNLKLVLILVLTSVLIILSGCSMPSFLGGDDKSDTSEEDNVTIENSAVTKKVKSLVSDYFTKVFSRPIDEYKNAGVIPEDLMGLLSKRTITEGANNPEIGLHFPRYIEMNGMVIVEYQFINTLKDKGIETTYIGKSSDELLYYSKVEMMVKCLPDSDFYLVYKQNQNTKLYEKQQVAIDETRYDYFRVVASYDVNIIKEGSDYKIKRVTEASTRPGFKNRVFLLNNEFVDRFPFINTDKTPDKKEYMNKEDGKRYEAESKLIEKFFANTKELDDERMNLLKSKWNLSEKDFTQYVKEVLKLNVDKDKKDIIEIDDKYKTKYSIDAFPLKANMNKILKITNYEIIPHPAYTKRNSRYIVKFDANVEMISGVIGQQNKYRYDYFVVLNNDVKAPKISSIYLNSVTNIGTQIAEK